jgi:pimeloyl-ACP methyl ester carboxylesterase
MFLYNPVPALNNYKGPKLIISATNEDNLPNALHNFAADVATKQIDGTGHWMQMDKPEEFNHALDDFLKIVEEAQY